MQEDLMDLFNEVNDGPGDAETNFKLLLILELRKIKYELMTICNDMQQEREDRIPNNSRAGLTDLEEGIFRISEAVKEVSAKL